MKAIPLKKHSDYISSHVPLDTAHEVLLKEIDEDGGQWYLIEINTDSNFDAYNTDHEFKAGKIKRPYISPNYNGADKHNCVWVRQKHCKELVDIKNNHEALGLLRRD